MVAGARGEEARQPGPGRPRRRPRALGARYEAGLTELMLKSPTRTGGMAQRVK
jgi:hypothetical protein